MTASGPLAQPCPEELRILLFSVQGVTLGADASQIEEMLEVSEASMRGLQIRPIDEEFSFGARPAAYEDPRVITIRDQRRPLAVLIDRPDDIATVKVDSIQGMPRLIAAGSGVSRAIWGAVVSKGGVILLVDFLKLRPHTTAAQVEEQPVINGPLAETT